MKHSRFSAVLALSVCLSNLVLAVEPLDHFSSEAGVVIRLKDPKATIEKAAVLADAVRDGFGERVRQNATALGMAISIPGLSGVDQTRDWYAVLFFAPHQSRPDIVFAIPATNAEQLTSALPDRMTFKVDGDWVLYTDSDVGISGAVDSDLTISSVMKDHLADVFDRGDVSVFINVDQLTNVYSEDIQSAHETTTATLKQVAAMAPRTNEMDMTAIMDMYAAMIDGCFAALGDAGGCSIALTVRADGAGIEEYAEFADGSTTAEFLNGHPTSAMDWLSTLPQDAGAYFGIRGDTQRLMDWSMSMSASMLPDDPESQQKFDEAWQAWKRLEFGDMVGSFSLSPASEGLFRYTAVAEVTPGAQLQKLMREITESFGVIKTYGIKQTMTIQPDAEKIGERSIDLLTVKQEFDSSLDPTGMQQTMQRILFGPDGMISRVAYLDEGYAMTMGGGRAAMETLLKSLDSGSNQDLVQHRTGLIAEPNILVLVDVSGMVVQGMKAAGDIPGIPIPVDADRLAQLTIRPSYVGFSLATETNAIRAKTVVPLTQLRSVNALVGLFR